MDNEKRSFEEVYRQLTETVHAMEDPAVTLEQSMELYERAGTLVVECERILKDAKTEITDINTRISELRARELGDLEE